MPQPRLELSLIRQLSECGLAEGRVEGGRLELRLMRVRAIGEAINSR